MGTRMAKISGTLQELSGEELARQQGMEAAPVTPLGAVGVGASADVAKMSGTGEQVRAAIRETLKERTRTTETMGEAERGAVRERFGVGRIQQQLGQLEGLGSLDNRVAEQIRANMLKFDKKGIANKVNVDKVRDALSKGGTVQPTDEQVTAAVEELAKLQASATPEEVVKVLAKLGISATITDTSASLAEELAPYFDQATKDDITALIEKNAKENAQLTVKEIGENFPGNKANVAAILDITTAELDEWTLEEVKAGLAAYSSQNFANVDELREVLASPSATQSQKDFARKRLAELGAVGVTSLEEKANDLETQMTEGDTVRFGNEQIPVSQILTNPKYKAIVAGALADPEAMADLEKTDPDMANWIKANEAKLVDVRSQLAKGTDVFVKLQKDYNDYVKDVPVDILDKLSPGWRDAKSMPLEEWKKTLPVVLSNTLNDTVPASKAAKLSAISALLPLNADFKIFSAKDFDAIATEAGNDPAKAAEYAKAWYDTSLSGFNTELTPNFKLNYVPDTGDTEATAIFNDASALFVERLTGTKQSLQSLIDEINKLKGSKKASDRVRAIELKTKLGQVKDLMNNKLTKSNIQTLKERKQEFTNKNSAFETKNKDLNFAKEGSSITYRTIDDADKYHPGLKDDMINNISRSFQDHYGYMGEIMRIYLENRPIEEAFRQLDRSWPSKKLFNKEKDETMPDGTPDAIRNMFAGERTLDNLLLGMAKLLDLDRSKFGDKGKVSKANWASSYLFELRDNKESEGRQRAATLQRETDTLRAERDNSKSYYDDFFNTIVAG